MRIRLELRWTSPSRYCKDLNRSIDGFLRSRECEHIAFTQDFLSRRNDNAIP
jgi:hypothetical protein